MKSSKIAHHKDIEDALNRSGEIEDSRRDLFPARRRSVDRIQQIRQADEEAMTGGRSRRQSEKQAGADNISP